MQRSYRRGSYPAALEVFGSHSTRDPKLHVRETTLEDLRPHEERTPTICLQHHLPPETLTTESLGVHGLNCVLWRKTCWGPNPQDLRKGPYSAIGLSQTLSSYSEVIREGLNPTQLVFLEEKKNWTERDTGKYQVKMKAEVQVMLLQAKVAGSHQKGLFPRTLRTNQPRDTLTSDFWLPERETTPLFSEPPGVCSPLFQQR